jgi:hypothetical protein
MSIPHAARRIAAALTVVGAIATAPTPTSAAPLCLPVQATGTGQDSGGTTQATISVKRIQIGTTTAAFVPTGTNAVLDFTGTLDFTAYADLGTLAIRPITGTFNTATGSFRAEGDVAGGGLLAGVTGHLVLQGVENVNTGEFTETITGRLCSGQRPAVLSTLLAGT